MTAADTATLVTTIMAVVTTVSAIGLAVLSVGVAVKTFKWVRAAF